MSNCFRTRAAFLRGVPAHLPELDRAYWQRAAGQPPRAGPARAGPACRTVTPP